jgi:hypothetical protein
MSASTTLFTMLFRTELLQWFYSPCCCSFCRLHFHNALPSFLTERSCFRTLGSSYIQKPRNLRTSFTYMQNWRLTSGQVLRAAAVSTSHHPVEIYKKLYSRQIYSRITILVNQLLCVPVVLISHASTTQFDVCNTPSSERKNNSVYIQRLTPMVRRTLRCLALHLDLASLYKTLCWLSSILRSS